MFIKQPKLSDKEKSELALGRALRWANYQGVDKKTREMILEYNYTYEGTLEFYFETGMEGRSSNLHDNRGWEEFPEFNNKTKKWDVPTTRFKSLEWSVFLRGGEYLEVYDIEDKLLWKGMLVNDIISCAKKDYCFHFLPLGIEFDTWVDWCSQEFKAKVHTNEPVLAEDSKFPEYSQKTK